MMKLFSSKLCPAVLAVAVLAGCSGSKKSEPAVLDIQGTIQVAPALVKMTKPSDTIFLIAKTVEGGPPLAVIKFTGNQYPYAFHITKDNLMIQREVFDVPLNLTVRVDKDGDASTRSSGDLFGAYDKNPVSIQAKDVAVTVGEIAR